MERRRKRHVMALDMLPRELIIHILQFLSLSDRKAIGLTSTYLYEATLDFQLLQNVIVVISDNLNAAISVYRCSRLPLQHLVFKEVEIQTETISDWKEFWENIGRNLISLSFQNCDISERNFTEIILSCPKLQSLQLNRSDSIFMSGNLFQNETHHEKLKDALKNLSEIKLNNNRYLSDCLFNRLMMVMPNIEKLSLAGCQISFHPAIYKRFYPSSRAQEEFYASDSVFTIQNVLKCLNKQSSQFLSIDLSQTDIDGNSLVALARVSGLNLQELYLAHCDQLSSAAISTLCAVQTKLLVLDLSYSSKISNNAINAICEHLTKLQHLYLRSCQLISDLSTSLLWKLDNLKTLNLSSCKQIASIGITSLSETAFLHLRTLNLSACFITENSIVTIAEKLPNLFHLDLSSCRIGVRDLALRAIALNLKHLRTLHIAWCDEVSDYGLGASNTEDKSSTSRQQVTVTEPLSNLRSLKDLDLCACAKLTDGAINSTIRFIELQYLNLSLCKNITDKAVACLGLYNPSLETLLLSQCHLITDDGVVNMVKYLPRLKHLDLQGCKMLTNCCLDAVGRYCFDLKYIDVSICPGITQDGIDALELLLTAPYTIHKRHIQPKELL